MAELPKSVWGRLSPPGLPDEHPDADLLAAFCEGALQPAEQEQMLAHLATCAQCREVVALITPAEGPPQVVARPKRTWLSFPVLRWAGVAAAALVVLAVALLHRPESPRPVLRSDAEAPKSSAPAGLPDKQVAQPQLVVPEKAQAAPAQETNLATQSATRDTEIKPKGEPRHPAETGLPSSVTADVASGVGYTDLDARMKKEKADQVTNRDLFDRARSEQSAARLPSAQASHGPAAPSQQQIFLQNTVPVSPLPGSGSDEQKKPPTADKAFTFREEVQIAPAPPPVTTAAVGKRQPSGTDTSSSPQVMRNANSIAPRGSEANAAAAPPPPPQSAPVADKSRKAVGGPLSRTQAEASDSFTTNSAAHGVVGGVIGLRAMQTSGADIRWDISPEGKLLRRVANGNPQIVAVAGDVPLRAVASIAAEVWAGGSHGALYHSSDAGTTWKPAFFPTNQDIIAIEFSNVRDGLITTADGHRYTTHDGGQTWSASTGR